MANILFLDNFDSFTYNLVDQFRVLGHNVKIYRNDTNLEQVVQEALNTPDTILALSPGPGTPACSKAPARRPPASAGPCSCGAGDG